jgi:hypothetical protein
LRISPKAVFIYLNKSNVSSEFIPISVSLSAPAGTIKRSQEVLFTERGVRSSEAASEVPAGYRMASPEEVSLSWKNNKEFREKLYSLPGTTWTAKTGLDSLGPHKIDDVGNHASITLNEFMALPPEDRSWHCPGKNVISMGGDYGGRGMVLGVRAYAGSEAKARVAYVKIGKSENPNAELVKLAREEATSSQT